MEFISRPSALLVILGVMSLVPFVAIMTTSFVKLAVVFSILRNALGLQSIPPNMAVYGLAIILTVYIMAPVGFEVQRILAPYDINLDDPEKIQIVFREGSKPIHAFLKKHTDRSELRFFLDSARKLWPEEEARGISIDSFFILVPAFTVSELTSAFEIGFLLYLPFIAIDLVISNILLAMGMMMVSPMTISLPFKLLLFVLIDGWAKLIHALVLTYQ
ncbi:MAG: type III secretion system export apparatus subunit SctR [Gammaproteobacteria bacterium]